MTGSRREPVDRVRAKQFVGPVGDWWFKTSWYPALPVRARLTRPIAGINPPWSAQEARCRILCALRNVCAHRVPSRAGPSPRAAEAPFHVGRGSPDSQHCRRPKVSLAHTPHSSHQADSPADSPREYSATMVPLYHRPYRMIAESGTPARVRPTRPPWLENPVYSSLAGQYTFAIPARVYTSEGPSW